MFLKGKNSLSVFKRKMTFAAEGGWSSIENAAPKARLVKSSNRPIFIPICGHLIEVLFVFNIYSYLCLIFIPICGH